MQPVFPIWLYPSWLDLKLDHLHCFETMVFRTMYWGNDPKHAEQESKEFKKWNILDEFNLACVWHAEEQTRGKKVEI